MVTDSPKCDICGELATQFTRDIYRSDPGTGIFRFTPVPHVKCGCDDHPPQDPQVIDLGIEAAEDPVRVLLRGEFDSAWGGWRG